MPMNSRGAELAGISHGHLTSCSLPERSTVTKLPLSVAGHPDLAGLAGDCRTVRCRRRTSGADFCPAGPRVVSHDSSLRRYRRPFWLLLATALLSGATVSP